MHFGWLLHKQPFFDYSDRIWKRLTASTVSGDGAGLDAVALPPALDAQHRERREALQAAR
jgi:hypothetical protein